MDHNEITALLRQEIEPVTGCTGPTAYALAAAACRQYLTAPVQSIRVYVSPAYLKMGFGVATPGTTETGIEIATAAGLTGGSPAAGMQVLKSTTDEHIRQAEELLKQVQVSVFSSPGEKGVYVRDEIETAAETVEAVVSHTHDGLRLIRVNGQEVFRRDPAKEEERIEDHPQRLSLADVFDYADSCTLEEAGFLLEHYRTNLALAEDGIRGGYGMKTGQALLRQAWVGREQPPDLLERPLDYLPADMEKRIRILVSGASDGRMGGSRLPAVAAMGDGNQGLTLLLPLGVAGEALASGRLATARAMALGALMLFYVKMHIGRAAATCLCAIAAASGVAAGYGRLRGLDREQIKAAVKNVISPLTGMLCDGAKNACALKMSVAAATALQAVELAEMGSEPGYYDGVCDETLEDTVSGVTDLVNETMDYMDDCMVRVILNKTRRRTADREAREREAKQE